MILNSRGISSLSVEKRIDNKVTPFSFDLLSRYNPIELMAGRKIQYTLKNLSGASGDVLFNGRIEKIDDTIDVNKRIFNVTGRNVAMFLEEQPFYAPCYLVSTGSKRKRSFQWLASRIITGTGVKLGPEILEYNQEFDNDPSSTKCFCGMFEKRSDAIDWLLTRYGELNNKPANWYQWWVDTSGYIRVLDTTNTDNIPTLSLTQFPSKLIQKIKLGFNVQNIENDITVIGGSDSTIRVRVYDKSSIKQFGRRVASTITDTSLTTESAVNTRANEELQKRSQVVIVGEITMAGFPQTECGLAIKLLFSERYTDYKFIFTSIKHTGKPGNYQTVIGISTDRNVLVNPNLSDIIEQIVKANTTTTTATTATVTAVNTETSQVSVVPVSLISGSLSANQNAAITGKSALYAGVL